MSEHENRSHKADSNDTSSELLVHGGQEPPLPDGESYHPYWDWELANSAAAQATEQSRWEEALSIYDKLLALSSPDISRGQRQTVYLAAGRAYSANQDSEKAIVVWTAGKDALKDSTDLPNVLLSEYIRQGRFDEADNALKEFETRIAVQLTQLDGVFGTRLGPMLKERARDHFEQARWQADVYHGVLQLQRGFYRDAADRLAKAFSSPLAIQPPQRIECGRALAQCYDKLQLYDLAGETLDQCVVMEPTNVALRRAAASAWRQLGAIDRVEMQTQAMDDGSFTAALEILEGKTRAVSALPPEQRDVKSVREAIQVARLRLEALPESQRATQPVWLLEMYELAFSDSKSADQQPPEADLTALATKYPTVPEVQKAVISGLIAHKKFDSAKVVLQRLKKIADVSGKPDDASEAVLAEAMIANAAGDTDQALATLRQAIASMPKVAIRFAKAGAALAMVHRRNPTAYEILKLVPEESWDVDAFMLAGRLSMSSDSAGEIPVTEADLQRWEEKLHRLEGENGCNWRYLAAMHLINNLNRNPSRTELLERAEAYSADIDRIRPHWGMGAALGGQIAALQGDREKAVVLLRRALQNGDHQHSTILLLISQLSALNRLDDASMELKRLGDVPESVIPTSMMEASLAQRKGDLQAALEAARKATSRSRNDANTWIVTSQIAYALSRAKGTPENQKAKLLGEAWDALEQAATITGGKDINVWNARLGYLFQLGDKEKVKQELKALEAAPLARNASLLAAAKGYLELRDFETAQARAKEAIALDPNDAQPHVMMANILEHMGDRPAMLGELQAAHQLAKDNAKIREWLATAYVLASEEIPWSEVDGLLTNSSDTSSTRSTLLRAALSLERGDDRRVEEAIAALTALANSADPEAVTAKRVLARKYAKDYQKADAEGRATPLGRLNFEQARSLYEDLIKVEPLSPADGVAFALLLIEAGKGDEAKNIANKLSAAGTSVPVLQLRLRIAKLQGEDVSSVASAWIADASGFEQEQLWELVGKAMSQLELHDEALVWLEKAYQKSPTKFAPYALGLARAGKTKQALDLCLSLIEKDGNLGAALLLPEIALLNRGEQQSEAVEQALARALKEHGDSAQLLESIATLRLTQERFAEAVALFEQSDRVAPNRARTLNNLAMALLEVPGRENAALERITKAIRLYGKHPQLLDTLAIVQSRLGQHQQAKASLEQALSQEKDPRFQMRLAEELLALGDPAQAKKIWEQVEQEQLKALGLTSAEQRSFNKLSKELGNEEQEKVD